MLFLVNVNIISFIYGNENTLKQMDQQETKKSSLKALNNIRPIPSHELVEKMIRNARHERLELNEQYPETPR